MFFKDKQPRKNNTKTSSVVLQLSRGDESQGHGVIQQRPCAPCRGRYPGCWLGQNNPLPELQGSLPQRRHKGWWCCTPGWGFLSKQTLAGAGAESELYSFTEKATSLVWYRGGGEYETPPRQPHKPDCDPAVNAGEQDHWARLLPVQKAGRGCQTGILRSKSPKQSSCFTRDGEAPGANRGVCRYLEQFS